MLVSEGDMQAVTGRSGSANRARATGLLACLILHVPCRILSVVPGSQAIVFPLSRRTVHTHEPPAVTSGHLARRSPRLHRDTSHEDVHGLRRTGSSFVTHISQDSAGYLWFSTRDGLSRYNGYEFTTYSRESGFLIPTISYCLQTRQGDYVVLTNDGRVYRWPSRPSGSGEPSLLRPLFDTFRTRRVFAGASTGSTSGPPERSGAARATPLFAASVRRQPSFR